jgi:hypothetical protein
MVNAQTNYLTYFHLFLEINSQKRYMGLVNHLQVGELLATEEAESPIQYVRFWNGQDRCLLEGTVTLDEAGDKVSIDMGESKSYHFRKLGR